MSDSDLIGKAFFVPYSKETVADANKNYTIYKKELLEYVVKKDMHELLQKIVTALVDYTEGQSYGYFFLGKELSHLLEEYKNIRK